MNHERDGHATYQLQRLREGLRPFKLHWFPTLGSTNTHAARMRREKRLLAPAVVLTGRQTSGRGRGANVWHAPAGVVTVTFVLPAHETLAPQHVPLVAGLVIRDAVAALAGDSPIRIKWPNDLWADGDRKLAGLLCERIDRVDLIGVGINANLDPADLPAALRPKVASLHALAGAPVDVTSLVVTLAHALRDTLGDARTSFAAVLPSIQRHDALAGRQVRVSSGEDGIEGRCEGIDPQGRLIVRTAAGVVPVVTGHVNVA